MGPSMRQTGEVLSKRRLNVKTSLRSTPAMINIFRVNHLVYDLRNQEVMEAFMRDPESEMDRYYLSEEDKTPLRTKNLQPLLDAGVNPNVLRPLCQALGIPPINLSTRISGSQQREQLQRFLVANSGMPESRIPNPELTPEEEQKRKRIKEIEDRLKLVDPFARFQR